jgi:hypothetical protein
MCFWKNRQTPGEGYSQSGGTLTKGWPRVDEETILAVAAPLSRALLLLTPDSALVAGCHFLLALLVWFILHQMGGGAFLHSPLERLRQ